jgi:glucose/arabinose dehydrogenase
MNKKAFLSILCGFAGLALISFKTTYIVQERWKAPAEADTLKSPFAFTPQVIREGETLFNTYCVSCHGKSGFGDGSPGKFKINPANFHSKAVADQTDGALFWKMSTGRGISMPSYGAVFSEAQRWQLVSYVRQFSKGGTAEAPPAPAASLVLSKFKIDAKLPGQYFALPAKVSNAFKSEVLTFMVDTVAKGMSRPWSMVFLPDNRALIAQRDGKLLQVKNGKLQADPIGGNVPKGLRDLKLHPQFAKNKLLYISYYIDPVKPDGGYTVLMRAKLEGDKLVDEQILYKAGPFKGNGEWYGSKMAFDSKGYLYFTVPIKGGRSNAQDLSVTDAKTMRFNDDGTIPKDNPFVNTPKALPEIYTYGHRVNEGLAMDPKTGKVYSTEFGELGGDELNVLSSGRNYGWPMASYSLEYKGSVLSKTPLLEGTEPPVHHFAIAPSDVDFIYGDRYPGWNGSVVIGGLAAKMVLRSEVKNNVFVHDERLLENIGRVRDVKVAPDKFLYVLTEDTGLMVRLIPLKQVTK